MHYCSSSDKDADEALTDINEPGVETWKFQSDFSNIDNVDRLFEKIERSIGTVDFLINNASVFTPSKLTTLSAQLLQTTDEMIVLPCVFEWLDNNRTLLDKKMPADFLINKFVAILIENNRVLCQKMTRSPTSSY